MACGACGGSGTWTNPDGYPTVCSVCSGSGSDKGGSSGSWFSGPDPNKNKGNGGGFPCLTILGIMFVIVTGFAIGLWSL